MDADMMETETSTPIPAPIPTPMTNSEQGSDVARGLLTLARQLIDQGNPSQALQLVVTAMRTKGGNDAVLQTLNRARELYRNKLQASADADQLSSLFAECAIAEALPLKTETSQNNAEVGPYIEPSQHETVGPFVEPDLHGISILAETGRDQIVLDASSDGSSFVCLQCGGLVSNHRKEEHYTYWCRQN